MILKLTLFGTLVGAAFFAGGTTVYSGLQIQNPLGSAFKMTPDPSNIWSHHESVSPSNGLTIPIVIDFDNNGKMDTEHKGVRVMITDIQVVGSASGDRHEIVDSTGVRWKCILMRNGNSPMYYERSFETPIVLPVGSKLEWKYTPLNSGNPFTINLIGRLTTM